MDYLKITNVQFILVYYWVKQCCCLPQTHKHTNTNVYVERAGHIICLCLFKRSKNAYINTDLYIISVGNDMKTYHTTLQLKFFVMIKEAYAMFTPALYLADPHAVSYCVTGAVYTSNVKKQGAGWGEWGCLCVCMRMSVGAVVREIQQNTVTHMLSALA